MAAGKQPRGACVLRARMSSRTGTYVAVGRPEHIAGGPLGSTLRAIRHRAGLTQATHATHAGLHQATVSRLETGERKSHSVTVLRRLALGVASWARAILDAAGIGGGQSAPRRRDGRRRRGAMPRPPVARITERPVDWGGGP